MITIDDAREFLERRNLPASEGDCLDLITYAEEHTPENRDIDLCDLESALNEMHEGDRHAM
jgi:hypothetical protein